MAKKTEINNLIQWANEIINNNMILIDDHIQGQGLCKIDHLVVLETGEGVFLCPVIDDPICCCLNAVIKEDDGYHWTHMNVGGNVWKDPRKNISDRCADYNAAESKNDDKIIRVIC